MQDSANPFIITQEQLVRYVFRQLEPEQESQVEDFLDANQHEADIVDGILKFCADHNIRTREAFDRDWGAITNTALEHFSRTDKPLRVPNIRHPSRVNKWGWATWSTLILLILGLIWQFVEMKTERDKLELERNNGIQKDSIIAALQSTINQIQTEISELYAHSKDSLMLTEINRLQDSLIRLEHELLRYKPVVGAEKIAIVMANAPPKGRNRGGNKEASGDILLDKADSAYVAGNYNKAIRLLQSIPASDPRYDRALQRLPYALFHGQFFSTAYNTFIQLMESDPTQVMESQYYLLLINVAEGRTQEARIMRATILANPKHPYINQTKQLPAEIFQQ